MSFSMPEEYQAHTSLLFPDNGDNGVLRYCVSSAIFFLSRILECPSVCLRITKHTPPSTLWINLPRGQHPLTSLPQPLLEVVWLPTQAQTTQPLQMKLRLGTKTCHHHLHTRVLEGMGLYYKTNSKKKKYTLKAICGKRP